MPKLRAEAEAADGFIADFLGETGAPDQKPQMHEIVLDIPEDEGDITQFSIRLMIVDDDYVMHRIVTTMLNDLGILECAKRDVRSRSAGHARKKPSFRSMSSSAT